MEEISDIYIVLIAPIQSAPCSPSFEEVDRCEAQTSMVRFPDSDRTEKSSLPLTPSFRIGRY